MKVIETEARLGLGVLIKLKKKKTAFKGQLYFRGPHIEIIDRKRSVWQTFI